MLGVWLGAIFLLLFSVLLSCLRERWVWFCPFRSVLKGFIIPGRKHQFGHLGRDRGMQPVKSPDSKNIKQSGASSPPGFLMLVEGKQMRLLAISGCGPSRPPIQQCLGPPCQGRATSTQRIGTFCLTKPKPGASREQQSSGTPAGKSRQQGAPDSSS